EFGPKLWKIEEFDKVVRWGDKGKIYRDPKTGLWWSKDVSGHGGSAWKLFEDNGKGLRWVSDADKFGNYIPNKHKGAVRPIYSMEQPVIMITSAEEFIRLRLSDDLAEYSRSASEPAAENVWRTIIADHPEMWIWVAHNKTIPDSVIRQLFQLNDGAVNSTLARKRKTPPDVLAGLAKSDDPAIRLGVAKNAKTPGQILAALANDDWSEVRIAVAQRLLGAPRGGGAQ
ncbi:MAG: hypothetical protein JSS02_06115, partial [Planctomycetes bacterium]|nr:hypothetical protein [Planctomycetota bacterium]